MQLNYMPKIKKIKAVNLSKLTHDKFLINGFVMTVMNTKFS
jgi:hypothetical protein